MAIKNFKKGFLQKIFFGPLVFTAVAFVLLVAVLVPVFKNASQKYRVDKEITDLREEVKSLETGNSDLKKLLAYLESDQFAEAEARLNFGLKKKGEEVVVIKSDDDSGSNGSEAEADDESQQSNAQKWLKYFLQGGRK